MSQKKQTKRTRKEKEIDHSSVVACLKSIWEARQKREKQSVKEANIKSKIISLFEVCGLEDARLEETPPDSKGRVDFHFYSAKLIGETKCNVNLNKTPKQEESDPEQLARYMKAYVEEDLSSKPSACPWRGILTDGKDWYVYDWEKNRKENMKLIHHHQIPESSFDAAAASFIEFFRQDIAPVERQGKPLPPPNLGSSVLRSFLDKLRLASEEAELEQHYTTKFSVWKNVLKGAGVLPPPEQTHRTNSLFISHTALVATARGIIAVLDQGEKETKKGEGVDAYLESLGDGFVSWVVTVKEGRAWATELYQCLSGYAWQGATRDVLRQAYGDLIPLRDRQQFGEYYTPDWLAAAVCEDTLDEDWLEQAVARAKNLKKKGSLKGVGALDPSCGSGTFLFHAARRIVSFARSKGHTPAMACKMAAVLVHGMDVHPVAVEMSRAVLRTALPALPPGKQDTLNVYVGDSLQTEEFKTGDIFSTGMISIPSTKNKRMDIPRSLLQRPDYADIIRNMVAQAVENKTYDMKKYKIDKKTDDGLRETHKELTEICKDEGNHVWAWQICNTAKPLQLSVEGVDRLIGNPPWLVPEKTFEGWRKDKIQEMQVAYGLRSRSRGSSAKGDLASLFSVRVIDCYLYAQERTDELPRRFGLVLPGSALINQTWEPFRSGRWTGLHSGSAKNAGASFGMAWDLSNMSPPPFPHAPNGTCVVRGECGDSQSIKRIEVWTNKDELAADWSAIREQVKRTRQRPQKRRESVYRKNFSLGTCCRPLCLCMSTQWDNSSDNLDCIKIHSTYASTKSPWKEVGCLENFDIEHEATHSFLRAQTLKAFRAEPDALLFLPLFGDSHEVWEVDDWPYGTLTKTRDWLEKAEKIFQENRSERAASNFLNNIDWKKTATNQVRDGAGKSDRTKIVYNKSGNTLRAARIPAELIADDKCYWMLAKNQSEALYLVAILNARVLQKAWRRSKTSKLHFDLNPLRAVPIPKYDSTSKVHAGLVAEARKAEKGVATGNSKAIETAWKAIDKWVQRLLPEYAGTKT